jgi:DNA repair protein RadC
MKTATAEKIPACAAAMHCLCWLHANGGDVEAACDATERSTLKLVPAPRAKRARQPHYRAVSQPAQYVPARERLSDARDVWRALADIAVEQREHLVCFDMNVRHRIIARRIVAIGTLTGVDSHPREVFRPAIVNGAAAIILAHNHPSGDPTPSRQDIEMTQRMREVGELLQIPVLDHVIVVADAFSSLAERNFR